MPSFGSSVSQINNEINKIALNAAVPGVANSLADPENIGVCHYPDAIQNSGIVALPAGAPGVWTQLIAALSGESRWLWIEYAAAAGGASNYDLGVGGGGAEVLLDGPYILEWGAGLGKIILSYPIRIAVGTRLAARINNSAFGFGVRVRISYG